jgi:hypothetical protein
VAVVAQEPGEVVVFTDVIRDEVQGVRHDVPVGQYGGDVLVDRDIGILVHCLTHTAEVPSVVGVEPEQGQVGSRIRRDHEEVPHPGVVIDPPARRISEDQSIVTPAPDKRIGIGMLREEQ